MAEKYLSKITVSGVRHKIKDAEARESVADIQANIRQALLGLVNTGGYNSTSKKIELKHDSTVLAEIDATAFIKDGMVSNVVIDGGYIVITFNTDAGQEPIRIPLADVFNPSNYYTKSEMDDALAGKQDTLISGTNIKTINNTSIVDSGNLSVGTVTGVKINNVTKTPTSGTVDLGTVLTSTTSSVTSGSTTPITSGGVYTALQNYETKLSFTTSLSTSYNATRNQYCRFTTTLSNLGIRLPTSSLVAGDTCAFNFTTSSSFSSFTITGGTIKKMKDFAIEAGKTYEVVALYDGVKWVVTATEFE